MSEICMLFPGGKDKALTLSYDDGIQGDARLVSILKRYRLKGTFNLNSGLFSSDDSEYSSSDIYRRLSQRELKTIFQNSGMEIAVHSLNHSVLHQLDTETCTNEILLDRRNLERQFQTIIRGMAYPFDAHSAMVIECAKKCGIVYARTAGSSHNFNLPGDWMLWTGTCHHNDPLLFPLTEYFLHETVCDEPWLFYLWGHSYEFDEEGNWDRIEHFAQIMSKQADVWHATNMEIYSYIQAYNSLIRSADNNLLYNPTACTLYYRLHVDNRNLNNGSETFCIHPGETKRIC